MRKLIRYECPNCDAIIKDISKSEIKCEYCGSIIYLQKSHNDLRRPVNHKPRIYHWEPDTKADIQKEKNKWFDWHLYLAMWIFITWAISVYLIGISVYTPGYNAMHSTVAWIMLLSGLSWHFGARYFMSKRPIWTIYRPDSIFARYDDEKTHSIMMKVYFGVGCIIIMISFLGMLSTL